VVLGAAVKGDTPGQALRGRIEAAARYLKENPRTTAIVSGGKGPGEDITEAECMERELVRLGVPPERIMRRTVP
ncbi:MAG: YdcF family protein, partial [Clostridium sp.]|nr:YdcF family protein [Clostridium sp.]